MLYVIYKTRSETVELNGSFRWRTENPTTLDIERTEGSQRYIEYFLLRGY